MSTENVPATLLPTELMETTLIGVVTEEGTLNLRTEVTLRIFTFLSDATATAMLALPNVPSWMRGTLSTNFLSEVMF